MAEFMIRARKKGLIINSYTSNTCISHKTESDRSTLTHIYGMAEFMIRAHKKGLRINSQIFNVYFTKDRIYFTTLVL